MKEEVLGAKWPPSAAPMDQMVVPFVGLPASSVHVNAVPPHSCTSMSRCFWYQARNATGSFALKKIPPMPVTRFICASQALKKLKRNACHASRPNVPLQPRRLIIAPAVVGCEGYQAPPLDWRDRCCAGSDYGIIFTSASNSSGSSARIVVLRTLPCATVASANALAIFSSDTSEIVIRSYGPCV